ncbi:hypothetical protein D3C86_1976800 [compost metagenome]
MSVHEHFMPDFVNGPAEHGNLLHNGTHDKEPLQFYPAPFIFAFGNVRMLGKNPLLQGIGPIGRDGILQLDSQFIGRAIWLSQRRGFRRFAERSG